LAARHSTAERTIEIGMARRRQPIRRDETRQRRGQRGIELAGSKERFELGACGGGCHDFRFILAIWGKLSTALFGLSLRAFTSGSDQTSEAILQHEPIGTRITTAGKSATYRHKPIGLIHRPWPC